MVPDAILDGTLCPACGEASLLVSERGGECRACTLSVPIFPEEGRVSWLSAGADPGLIERIESEQAIWDEWAARPSELSADRSPHPLTDFFDSSRMLRAAADRHPELTDAAGKRVLDIGGSCLDTWRYLRAGAARVDQVEISTESQRLGARRLDQHAPDWRGSFWFHTSPAEKLPFQDNTFDIVFSRSTIHHTRRPEVFREIHRVLRPGGFMFLLEPVLPVATYHIMKVSRSLRRADRGTDDPLRRKEIHRLREGFAEVDWYPSRILLTWWDLTLGRLVSSSKIEAAVKRADEAAGNLMGSAYLFGTYAWIFARK